MAAELRGNGSEQAKRFYEEGVVLSRKLQFPAAELRLLKCLDTDPGHAPCYLALGALKARTHQPQEGAAYYRMFLRLAPNDARAPQVRKLLAEYDKSYRLD